ncbi:FAD/NAD(P)-binding domain-containing protein [Annulohypoxylon maeteangense]|uniref:FAD/NAD(P)-binding domain-containing protein n=1 Tax=Annulohypoxylon maeteangense TaxID=1927788 RepID=UPI002007C831|nr:FAD/NAD(P)-binding domain-containing protein [Annulohypoxylon maeteangense]KAI0889501.1 FAD/NAD(P)-binding domain-containing protein [Annulohypoxylon maeteangense]
MSPRSPPEIWQKTSRDPSSQLQVIIVGAGLGGLGAAIAILLAGHNVTVLESASEIGEIGAGIQVLPNSSRILISWGLEDRISKHATMPRYANMIGWKGNHLSRMDLHAYADALGTPFWDFHRANLHRCLLDRAIELGAKLHVRSRVQTIEYAEDGLTAAAVLSDGRSMPADLIVGADGISSRLRELLLRKPDPPQPTGDLAYRLIINAEDMLADPELRHFIQDPQVNYWIGPDAHAVNYVLRGGQLFNMVLLVPDDMPAASMTVDGNVEEMQALYKDWDPRIGKILKLCQSVQKWKLCIRPTLDRWTHKSGSFTLLGDAVHATLPYLASGCGMALEDGAALGLCLSKLTDKSREQKLFALGVYEECRKERTERVVERGNFQQYMYHIHDGEEQRERDKRLHMFGEIDERLFKTPEVLTKPRAGSGDDPLPWRYYGVGGWLLTYDLEKDVETRWEQARAGAQARPLL